MKKITQLFFLLMMGTSTISAYNGEDCCSNDEPLRSYTQPCGVYVGVNGSYVVPSESGLGSFTDSWQYANSEGGTTARSKPSRAHYKGAGGFTLGYDFPCSSYSIEANYFGMHNSKHNVHDTSDNPTSFGSAFFDLGIPLPPNAVFVSDSHLKYTLNQGDFKLGYRIIACSDNFVLRPTIGVRYLDLHHDLTFLIGNVRSSYYGAGPVLGFDANYRIWKGFALTSRFDASALMGSVRASSLLNFGALSKFRSPSTNRVVYTFGGRLGVSYDYQFCNDSSLKLELGYQVMSYNNPFDIIQATDLSTTPRIGTIGSTNFGLSGPYIELTWHM